MTGGGAPYRPGGRISPAALVCIGVSVAAAGLSALLSMLRGRSPVWAPDFGPLVALCLACLALSQWLHRRRSGGRLALLSEYLPLFGLLSMAMTLLSVSLLPLSRPLVDPALMAADRMIGFDWMGFAAALSDWPALVEALRRVYGTHLLQIAVIVGVLAHAGRGDRLEAMVLTAVIAAILGMAVWAVFPSFGPLGVIEDLPVEIAAALGPMAEHGAVMHRAALSGLEQIESAHLAGFIGFPSFHIVMAALAAWFARGSVLFLPLLLLNTAMIPATLLHGAHHFVDILGGLLVFLVSLRVAMALGTNRSDRFARAA